MFLLQCKSKDLLPTNVCPNDFAPNVITYASQRLIKRQQRNVIRTKNFVVKWKFFKSRFYGFLCKNCKARFRQIYGLSRPETQWTLTPPIPDELQHKNLVRGISFVVSFSFNVIRLQDNFGLKAYLGTPRSVLETTADVLDLSIEIAVYT